MPVTEKAVLTAELRLDVQEFYARYAECLDNGRLQQWPEFFLDSCISNFRVQAASDEELRVQANFEILRTFPGKRTEHFVSGTYDDRIAIAGRRLHFKEKLCVLDSDVPPDSLLYPI